MCTQDQLEPHCVAQWIDLTCEFVICRVMSSISEAGQMNMLLLAHVAKYRVGRQDGITAAERAERVAPSVDVVSAVKASDRKLHAGRLSR